MTVTVAPLTTTVMNTLAPEQAGLASGINNAVARAAGLLAIALLGLVMNAVFERTHEGRLAPLRLAPAVQAEVDAQRGKWAALALPATVAPETRHAVKQAVAHAFVAGFRWAMWLSALLAALSALAAWRLIGRQDVQAKKTRRSG